MNQILEVMGITEEDVKKRIISIIPRHTSLSRYAPRVVYDALPEDLDNLRRMDVLLLQQCYKELQAYQKKRAIGARTQFEKDFTEEYWTDFLNAHGPMTTPAPENQPPPPAPVMAPAAPASVASVAKDTRPTVSFKVDTKDIPKLPKGNKTIQGPAFDRWQILFENKLDQANCLEIIDATVDEPDDLDDDDEIEAWHQRDKWVRVALLQATYEMNAWSVIDRQKSGRKNYKALVAQYQSAMHQQEDAAHAEESLKNLYFDRSSKFTVETFLAKFEAYVKRINEGLEAGETFPQTLLASKFLAALQHPEYRTWKEIHKDDGWDALQVEYIKKSMELETAGRLRYGDCSDKYNI